MAEGAGEVGVDERFKTQDLRQKIRDKRGNLQGTVRLIFERSSISYPLSIINYPSITFYL